MDCRTTPTLKFKARLGWKRHHIVLTKKKKTISADTKNEFIGSRKYTSTV